MAEEYDDTDGMTDQIEPPSEPPFTLTIDEEEIEVTVLQIYPCEVEDTGSRRTFWIFKDSEAAGDAAKDYYKEMADEDPAELRALIGDENLIEWALGHRAGPGAMKVRSLDEWLDLWKDNPEDHWASYDGDEHRAKISGALADEVGIEHDPDDREVEVVCYRAD